MVSHISPCLDVTQESESIELMSLEPFELNVYSFACLLFLQVIYKGTSYPDSLLDIRFLNYTFKQERLLCASHCMRGLGEVKNMIKVVKNKRKETIHQSLPEIACSMKSYRSGIYHHFED